MKSTPLVSAKNVRGFTLIEIIVVVMIIGLLAAMIVPQVVGRADEARVQTTEQNIAALHQALRMYRLDNFVYPTTEQGLNALVSKPTIAPLPKNYRPEGYISKLPKDAWGNPFVYIIPGNHGEFDLYSLGADGKIDDGQSNDDVAPWKSK